MQPAQRIANLRQGLGQKGGYADATLRQKIQGLRQGGPGGSGKAQDGPGGHSKPGGSPNPIPWSAQYETTTGAAGRDFNQTNLDLAGQEQAVKQSYGFEDKTNPYSQAAQLERQYGQQRNQTNNSYAAQGQLYAGSLSNARNADSYTHDQSYDTLRRGYQGSLDQIARARIDAQNKLTDTNQQADVDRLQAAIAQTPEPATAPAPTGNQQGNQRPNQRPNQPNRPNRNQGRNRRNR
jgi:hypothetical protein